MTTVLPDPVAILAQTRSKPPPSEGTFDADPLRGRRLAQPDQGFDRFELAEEEAPGLELLRVVPVPEQAPGDGGGAGPAGFAPRLDPRADGVDRSVPRLLDRPISVHRPLWFPCFTLP